MSDQSVESFVLAVKRYMAWAEQAPVEGLNEAMLALDHVVELYHWGIRLATSGCGENVEIPDVGDDKWGQIRNRFSCLPFRNYSVIINAMTVPPEEPAVGDIADDLADVYRDLAVGLFLYNAGHKEEAIWQWHFDFHNHWKEHAAWAIFALNSYFIENPDKWDIC
jgi:hypothetical protein